MPKSRIPLIGLIHKADFIHKSASDDGAGGIDNEGDEIVVYSRRKCRITVLADDEDELKNHGFTNEHNRKVILPYSPKLRRTMFLRAFWGTPPNVFQPMDLPDGFPPESVISTPAGPITLAWSPSLELYQDSLMNYQLEFTAGAWQLRDAIESVTEIFPAYIQATHNIFKYDWSLTTSDYSVQSIGGPSRDYQIVWLMHQQDDIGGTHHTSLIIQLQAEDM